MDEETASLLLKLQYEDIEEITTSVKGKAREGDLSDAQLAMNMYLEELETFSRLVDDARMSKSLAAAIDTDQNVLQQFIQEERATRQDRHLAQRMLHKENTQPEDLMDEAENVLDDQEFEEEVIEKLRALYVELPEQQFRAHDLEQDGTEPESSSWAAGRGTVASRQKRLCEACHERLAFWEVIRVPCRHEYCRECINELFEAAMRDDTLFPPRCCRQRIPIKTVRIFMKLGLVDRFQAKAIEFSTPNRTYCSVGTCSTFIPPENIQNGIAACSACQTLTCATCKAGAHNGDCPNDTALQQVLETAREHGWQRCHACWTLVELRHGCNHMTCRCGAEFCYVCGALWKKCRCDQWDEHRLLARATEIVDRGAGIADDGAVDRAQLEAGDGAPRVEGHDAEFADDIINPARDAIAERIVEQLPLIVAQDTARARQVRATMDNLRENHQCEHQHWRFRNMPHQCEVCYHHLPQYIFECRQCMLMACNRCKRHRL